MRPYERLTVWRKAHELALLSLRDTASPALRTQRELAIQMRRAAISIPTNIAEGTGRATPAQFDNFLQIAIGSTRELAYLSRLAHDVGALPATSYAVLEARTDEIARMLVSLRRRIAKQRR